VTLSTSVKRSLVSVGGRSTAVVFCSTHFVIFSKKKWGNFWRKCVSSSVNFD
jgi:hypothetical protein